jgi:hypothetical protein
MTPLLGNRIATARQTQIRPQRGLTSRLVHRTAAGLTEIVELLDRRCKNRLRGLKIDH